MLSNIWGFANLIGEKWYHSVISILIALVMSEVERCVIYLRTTSFSFPVDFVSTCFAHFSLGLLVLAQVLSISLFWPFSACFLLRLEPRWQQLTQTWRCPQIRSVASCLEVTSFYFPTPFSLSCFFYGQEELKTHFPSLLRS